MNRRKLLSYLALVPATFGLPRAVERKIEADGWFTRYGYPCCRHCGHQQSLDFDWDDYGLYRKADGTWAQKPDAKPMDMFLTETHAKECPRARFNGQKRVIL